MSPSKPPGAPKSPNLHNQAGQNIDPALIERRRFIRQLPVPTAIERDDDEAWALWTEAVTSN